MINLMPHEIKQEIHYARQNVTLVQYCILAAIISVAVAATMLFGLTLISSDERSVNDAITEREAELVALQAQETSAKELTARIDTIASLLKREVDFSEIILEIGAVIPAGATLTNLSLPNNVKSTPFELNFTVSKQSTAAVLQQNFEKSEFFTGADVQNIAPGDLTENGVVESYNVGLIVSIKKKKSVEAAPAPASESGVEAPAAGGQQ